MHIALYRKYRPQKFSEVLGQEPIISALTHEIKNKKISHAYLFAGGRGTGKTSVARIFAREIGCFDEDIYEIDAASNRSIDDVRAIRDEVHTLPFRSPYKVYIIDEAHMLSKEAWNALLKTLEEPPEHVIFILATTEKHKVLDTIISRCQTFDFKKPSRQELSKSVLNVAKKEGYNLPKFGAEHIALLGEGSFRDALGILEKIILSSKDKDLEYQEIIDITGAPNSELIIKLIRSIGKKDSDGALSFIREIVDKNIEMKIFLNILLERLRFLVLLKYAPKTALKFKDNFSEDEYKELSFLAEDKSFFFGSETIVAFLEAYENISFASISELPIELAILKICENKNELD